MQAQTRKKDTAQQAGANDAMRYIVSGEILRALATATTAYYEASPDCVEQARIVYQEALERFKLAQSGQPPRAMKSAPARRSA